MGERCQAAAMLDACMMRRGLRNADVAASLAVEPNAVSMMRTGRMPIPACRVPALAILLRVEADVLATAGIAGYPRNRAWQALAVGRSLRAGC